MEKLSYPNVQVYPVKKMVMPNDRNVKMLFKFTKEGYTRNVNNPDGFRIVEMKNHKRFGKIATPVKISIDPALLAADPILAEPLNQFDLDVANVCISFWCANKRELSPSILYRGLTGKIGDHDANPSKDQLAAIMTSLKKLTNVYLEIYLHDVCIKLGYNKCNPITISNYIIPAQIVEGKINGQKTLVIKLTAESPLLSVATVKNRQLLSFDARLLHIPHQKNTPTIIELKHYIIRRVLEIILHPKEMTPSITFADVFEKCRLEDASPKKKQRARDFIKSFFQHLLNYGIITSYQVNKKDGAYYSVSFTFSEEMSKVAKQKPSEKVEMTGISGAVAFSTVRRGNQNTWQWQMCQLQNLPKSPFYIVLTPPLSTLQPSPNNL